MKLLRRQFLHLAASAAALPAISRVASAQTYPSRPVRIIVPFPAGGTNDIIARLIGQWLSERLGQQFIIENRAGAGTDIGTEVVVRAPADGYTLLLAGPPSAINATLYEKLNFNFMRDIAPVAGIIRTPVVPNVPTVGESGVTDYEAVNWIGVFAPAKTPKETLAKLAGLFTAALQVPETKRKLVAQGLFPVGTCGADFGAFIRKQYDNYGSVIRGSNIKVE